MPATLSPETIAIVKSTAPALQQHGVAITTRMYERLFVDPEIKALFDQAAQASGEQPRRLAGAILAFSKNADHLDALTGAIERIAERHVQTRIRPEHYPAVADALLPAIQDVLGDAADDRTLAAWGEAYWFLADVLKAREAALYAQGAQPSGARTVEHSLAGHGGAAPILPFSAGASMTNQSQPPAGAESDFESGVAALHDLVADLEPEAIRRIVRNTASIEQVDPGTCAQMLRTEVEAGRLPIDQFKALATTHGTPAP